MSNERYTVTNRIQSRGNPPVEMNWLRNGSPAEAISAVASIIAQGDDKSSSVPESVRPSVLSVTVTRVPETLPPWYEKDEHDRVEVLAEDFTADAESFRLAMNRNRTVHEGLNRYHCPFASCGGNVTDSLIQMATHVVTDHLHNASAAELDGALDYIREAGKRFQNA